MRWIAMTLWLTSGCGPSKVADDTGEPRGCDEGAPEGIDVGMCAPEFNLPDSEGVMTRLSSFRGKVALVDISALW